MTRIESILMILVCMLIIYTFVFQFIFPKIDGTQTFPIFRRRKVKGVPRTEVLTAELEELTEAQKATSLEFLVKQQREQLVAERTKLTQPTVPSKIS